MLRAFFALALIALGLCAFFAWRTFEAFDAPGPHTAAQRIYIERGSGTVTVANQLEREGLIEDPLVFKLLTRLEDKGGKIRAGEFAAPAKASPRALLTLLTEGPTIVRKFTVPEGALTIEALAIVQAAEGLIGDVPQGVPEGALLPETYHYSWNDSRTDVIARMRQAMTAAVQAAMATKPADHPVKTAADLVTLASIIEKETGVGGERALVSGVFVNRLRKNMLLQSDPTTIYAVTRGKGPLGRGLRRSELALKDPYNTYQSAGLPPGPIANPGKAALMAAANPAVTDALYFVADGTGGHAFARTLRQHNRNVQKWRIIERQRRRQ
jgi:UPF0755 protein